MNQKDPASPDAELEPLPWEQHMPGAAPAVTPIKTMSLVPHAAMDLQAQIDNAGKFMELQSKIRMMAVKLTNCNDWEDQKGIPYLKWQGAAKIRSAFGVSYTPPDIRREDCRDEKGAYIMYHAEAMVSWQGATIPCVGTGSTRDPFFGKKNGQDIPLSEIDLTDIKKKACTNMLNRGLRDLLGLTFTWEEIDKIVGGTIKEGARKQDYKEGDKPPAGPSSAPAPTYNCPPGGDPAPLPPLTTPAAQAHVYTPGPAPVVVPSTPAPLPQNSGGDVHIPHPAHRQQSAFPPPAKPEHALPPKASGELHTADQTREIVWAQLVEICGPDHAASKLEELTAFQGDRGPVAGKRSMRELTDRQVYRLVKIVGAEHKRFKEAFG